ncbi:MAG: hypothetical protein OXD49_06320 [Candidatus Poribacteria bacterium]|nr:hypothetical protein [Candidatus Poribacteria bacterium]
MKLILISITAFLIFAAPVFSELTVEDLEKIRSIVKESEDRLKEDLKASEKRLTEHIDGKVEEMDKRLNIIFGFVIPLISLIVVVIGVPQIIMVWRGREERTQKEQIQELKQEIEALKQHIANP